ncbi:MAG: hypothetical protein D6696_02005, partial [Acidobacteria bacterium]
DEVRQGLLRGLAAARAVADQHPERAAAQIEVAELAYKLRRWEEVIAYLERSGEIPPERPDLLFYLAVARYETGDLEGAAEALERCLPRIHRSAFVNDYAAKILGERR